jgi:D-amino-acid dehydrogenase
MGIPGPSVSSPGPRVLVIGAGVIGVCSAYFLARDGWQVTLVDRGQVGEGCSFGNAGLVVPSHCIPLAAPGVWRKGLGWLVRRDSPFRIKPRLDWGLLSWLFQFWRACSPAHVRRSLPLLKELSYASLRLFDELASLPGFDFDYARSGMLTVFRTKGGFEDGIEEARLLREAGVPVHVLGAAETESSEPYLLSGVTGGLLFEDDARLAPDAFVKGLAALAQGQGASLLPATEVTGFETAEDRIVAVSTSRGRYACDEIVLAAGSRTPTLARRLALRLPIEGGKGYSMTFERNGTGPLRPLILAEAKVAITPLRARVRFSGTLELAGQDVSIDRRRAESILRAAREWIQEVPELDGTPVWSGLRPCTPDGLPLLGRPARYRNLIIAAGHAMIGVSLGPITGRLVANLVARRSTISLEALHPDRFDSWRLSSERG